MATRLNGLIPRNVNCGVPGWMNKVVRIILHIACTETDLPCLDLRRGATDHVNDMIVTKYSTRVNSVISEILSWRPPRYGGREVIPCCRPLCCREALQIPPNCPQRPALPRAGRDVRRHGGAQGVDLSRGQRGRVDHVHARCGCSRPGHPRAVEVGGPWQAGGDDLVLELVDAVAAGAEIIVNF